MGLRASCTCTSTILLRAGAVTCASCGAPIVDEQPRPADDEYSTRRLPADAKSADDFNRACRSGRVRNARKVGRVWLCSRADWNARKPASPPKLTDEAKANARAKKKRTSDRSDVTRAPSPVEAPRVSDALLRELGQGRRTG